tara:strand:- start:1713 stop:2501 length:789 start_codon:yes stop_codon:yes gene_type:complete
MTSETPTILVERIEPTVVRITLNRPEQRNALSMQMMDQLQAELAKIGGDDNRVRAVIFQGAGKVFCAGLDLAEAMSDQSHRSARAVAETLQAVADATVVTIAIVHGAAVAGGAGLMSACDFVVAEEGTRIGFPEVRRGLVGALVTTFLRRQIGERHLREMLIGGGLITAERALAMGLVNRVVPTGRGQESADEFVREIHQGAPKAISRTKELLACGYGSIREDLDAALESHLVARNSEEAVEGIAAFLEKREPHWAKENQPT